MYVRLITFHPRPDVTAEDAREIYRELIEILQDLEGFCGCSLLLNEETRRGISVTYWDDAATAERAGEVSLPVLLERVSELVESPPDVSGYEVLDHRMQDD